MFYKNSAMLLQDSRNWYSEEGQLSQTLCEQNERDLKFDEFDCCACDEAKYNVRISHLNTVM